MLTVTAVLAIGHSSVAELLLCGDNVFDFSVLHLGELSLRSLTLLTGDLDGQKLLRAEQGAQMLRTKWRTLVKLRSHFGGNSDQMNG